MISIACWLTGHGEPVRQFVGGFRCPDCGESSADLEGLGWGAGYVPPVRRQYDRVVGGGVGQVMR